MAVTLPSHLFRSFRTMGLQQRDETTPVEHRITRPQMDLHPIFLRPNFAPTTHTVVIHHSYSLRARLRSCGRASAASLRLHNAPLFSATPFTKPSGGSHLISEAPTRVTLRACQALSRVRLALARLQWSASATTILTADRAIALVADSVSFAQRQEPAPCLVGGRRLGACPSGRRYRGAVPCAHGWSKRRTAAG